MLWRKVLGAVLLIAFCSIPVFLGAQISSNSQSVKDIRRVVGENTPEFIAKPIVNTIVWLENFQIYGGIEAEVQRMRVENEIKTGGANIFIKAVKYTELGSYIVWSDIINNQFFFYFLLSVLVLIIIVYIARLFFF